MKLFYKIFGTAMIAAAAAASCTDLDNLEQRIDSLESRIAAIEAQLDGFNDNIEALGAFAEGNRTISNVAENNGVYTITLSDNTTITLDQGSTAATPVVTVDENKYWMVDYNDGNGPQYLLNSAGEKVQAGTTPLFGVDEDGYWTVSYDDGESYVQVTDPSGNPVSAVSDEQTQDSFFKDVAYNEAEGTFTVILLDDRTFTLPVVPGFVCAIENVEGAQVFELNETKTYPMTVNGESEMTVFKPEGWTAIVSENAGAYTLSVTAPAQATTLTKAVIADSRSDISVLAISSTGFAAMAKMQVELSEAPIPATATVTAVTDAATETSLTYTVSPDERTDSWKYIHQLATEPAPTAETQGWIDGTETTVVFTELEDNTEYTLYVLPAREGVNGTIASATGKTLKSPILDYYQAFIDGEDIEIGGTVYNISQFAEENVVHCTESVKISSSNNGQILFIAPDCEIAEMGNMTNVIIVGDDPDSRPTITITNPRYLVPESGQPSRVIFKNINIVPGPSFTNYMFAVNKNYSDQGAFGEFVLDNCDITMTEKAFYSISAARYLDKFVMENCRVKLPVTGSDHFILSPGQQENTFSEITFRNNVFYCESGISNAFRLVSGATNSNNKTTIGKITVENNTFVNVAPTNSSMIIGLTIGETTFTKNLLFFNQEITAGGDNLSIIFGVAENNTGYPSTANCMDNIVYRGNNTKGFNMFYNGSYVPAAGQAENPRIIADDPFSGTGASFDIPSATFVPNSTYSSYGVQPVE